MVLASFKLSSHFPPSAPDGEHRRCGRIANRSSLQNVKLDQDHQAIISNLTTVDFSTVTQYLAKTTP